MTSYCCIISKIQIPSNFPSDSNVSDKIKKLANTLIIFNYSCDGMMTSFIVKEGSGTIRHLAFWN